jgi:outer membrane protein OmpA-like peptidoglycan-associated protein
MASDPNDLLRGTSDGGVAGDLPPREPLVVLAAPADGEQFNTMRASIVPLACWRLHDVRFAFDSSLVAPEAKAEMKQLIDLIDAHAIEDPATGNAIKPVTSIFGHADPIGNDDFNKRLSGRRAIAVYAMLVRDTDKWEELFSQPAGGDSWGNAAVQTMLKEVGFDPATTDGTDTPEFRNAVKSFQESNGLNGDSKPGPDTRKVLFRAYMDQLCVDDNGNPFTLDRSDFLGRGQDPAGRADFQGCSEFNPVLMFSKAESDAFAADTDKQPRNAANAPNRRVVAFLFQPGIRISLTAWPCPRAGEGTASCRKRFWSDADDRRKFQTQRREFHDTLNTFACRFYQRLATHSPCEDAGQQPVSHISVLLRSNSGAVPLARRKYSIRVSDRHTLRGTTDQDGLCFHPNVPPGDYPLFIDDIDTGAIIPTLPKHLTRRLTRVPMFYLKSDPSLFPDDNGSAPGPPNVELPEPVPPDSANDGPLPIPPDPEFIV